MVHTDIVSAQLALVFNINSNSFLISTSIFIRKPGWYSITETPADIRYPPRMNSSWYSISQLTPAHSQEWKSGWYSITETPADIRYPPRTNPSWYSISQLTPAHIWYPLPYIRYPNWLQLNDKNDGGEWQGPLYHILHHHHRHTNITPTTMHNPKYTTYSVS